MEREDEIDNRERIERFSEGSDRDHWADGERQSRQI